MILVVSSRISEATSTPLSHFWKLGKSQKFDTIQKHDKTEEKTNTDERRIKSLERELANEKSRIEELEERIREHEDAIRLKDEELIKSRDRIYDLERDVDQAGEVELLKNEQLTRVNFWTSEAFDLEKYSETAYKNSFGY